MTKKKYYEKERRKVLARKLEEAKKEEFTKLLDVMLSKKTMPTRKEYDEFAVLIDGIKAHKSIRSLHMRGKKGEQSLVDRIKDKKRPKGVKVVWNGKETTIDDIPISKVRYAINNYNEETKSDKEEEKVELEIGNCTGICTCGNWCDYDLDYEDWE